ncbi:hypothetical protein MTR67_022319 [Solanum verrucosum]|uniref:Uncharacterized protein n=1 Tax=Solanum verrucosum TaxID=315347 RepID=A0AAF0QRN0_SOLVR|nr:hypothetical protein MTR67_022319 [Solanum verrucosum]
MFIILHKIYTHVFFSCSKKEAKKQMVYSYRHGFSGFAAKLTNHQAKQIGELSDVVRVIQNPVYKTRTSRSWDFLGLSKNDPNNLLTKTNQGDGSIIGILDSGIWGDSEAFNDKGLGPIPSRWKAAGSYVNNLEYYGLNMGTVRGGAPNARIAMYKWFELGTFMLEVSSSKPLANKSKGFAFWVELIAPGLPSASYLSYVIGWMDDKGDSYCGGVDILAGIDDAIKDGVDVLSASFGGDLINFAEVDTSGSYSVMGIGSFHAASHGIPFVVAGGNAGPDSYTVTPTSPWIILVAASNEDREIVTPLTLANNNTILVSFLHLLSLLKGKGIFQGKEQAFASLVTFKNITSPEDIKTINVEEVKGKVLMPFLQTEDDIYTSLTTLNTSGVLAFIVATHPLIGINDYNQIIGVPIPFVYVDLEQGNQIFDYFQQCKSSNLDPKIKISRSEVLEGQKVYLKVPKFSSRGPSSLTPDILKPDIAAPGVNILAAIPPNKEGDNGFQLMSGTSMAAPHISGIIGLLKVAHPNWSPAAIKSALVTTAWNEDTYGFEIFSEGAGNKIADPFDFGGGICNPNGAMDPGLIYDMDNNDYLNYLCSLGYSNEKVRNATTYFFDTKNSTTRGIICPSKVPSRLDLNLPSISIPNLENSVTIRRTVTNVGNVNSIYKLVVKPPRNSAIKVSPHVLKFNSKTKKISFEVKIISTHQRKSKFNFGSLAWSDGKHYVRIPIAVRK